MADVLVKYWETIAVEIEFDWFLHPEEYSVKHRIQPFARRRIDRIADWVGKDEVDKAVREAREEVGKRAISDLHPRHLDLWRIIRQASFSGAGRILTCFVGMDRMVLCRTIALHACPEGGDASFPRRPPATRWSTGMAYTTIQVTSESLGGFMVHSGDHHALARSRTVLRFATRKTAE